MNNQLELTTAAATKILDLISADGNPELKLRVYIMGGGCSGFQYGFAFDKLVNEDDTIINKELPDSNTVQLIVDAMSLEYLHGAAIDYVENLRGSHFTVQNPNAKTTCGCGSSFAVD